MYMTKNNKIILNNFVKKIDITKIIKSKEEYFYNVQTLYFKVLIEIYKTIY